MNKTALDTNILVYAVNEDSKLHEGARKLVMEGGVVTWQNLVEFYAVVTDSKRLAKNLRPDQALREVKSLIESKSMGVVLPNSRTGRLWMEFLRKKKVKGQRVHDLFLAATLLSNDVRMLITENTDDFAGVTGLKTVALQLVKEQGATS